MRIFAKVAESRSFAAAAARLNFSAGMVSQHVKALEDRLGARLLNRTTRKVSLTEVGRAYYERCTRLLADLEEAERAASDLQTAPRGDLRVNATPSFGMVPLAPAVAGHGLACLPTYLVGEALRAGRLVTVLDDYVAPPFTLRALYPHSRHLSAKVRAFVDFLAERFAGEPAWDSWSRRSLEEAAD